MFLGYGINGAAINGDYTVLFFIADAWEDGTLIPPPSVQDGGVSGSTTRTGAVVGPVEVASGFSPVKMSGVF